MRRAVRASFADTPPVGPRAVGYGSRLLVALLLALSGCGDTGAPVSSYPASHGAALPSSEEPDADMPGAFTVELPPWQEEDVFPCSECHNGEDVPLNSERRELEMAHEHIDLKHDEKHRWCLDCHDEQNRDKLRLASGVLIDFKESHRLCGPCHGDKHRDWRAGIHGRRTGRWDGEKEYLLCVHCHWAHAPQLKPLEPLPAPVRPEAIR